jgi:hypothetical protein
MRYAYIGVALLVLTVALRGSVAEPSNNSPDQKSGFVTGLETLINDLNLYKEFTDKMAADAKAASDRYIAKELRQIQGSLYQIRAQKDDLVNSLTATTSIDFQSVKNNVDMLQKQITCLKSHLNKVGVRFDTKTEYALRQGLNEKLAFIGNAETELGLPQSADDKEARAKLLEDGRRAYDRATSLINIVDKAAYGLDSSVVSFPKNPDCVEIR